MGARMDAFFDRTLESGARTDGVWGIVVPSGTRRLAPWVQRLTWVTPLTRILVPVVARDRSDAHESLGAGVHVLEQPDDRGSLPAVLLSLLHVLPRDPGATVLVVSGAEAPPANAALLGASLAEARRLGRDEVLEEPHLAAARATTLGRLVHDRCPAWWDGLCDGVFDWDARVRTYRALPPVDLWADVLAAPRREPIRRPPVLHLAR